MIWPGMDLLVMGNGKVAGWSGQSLSGELPDQTRPAFPSAAIATTPSLLPCSSRESAEIVSGCGAQKRNTMKEETIGPGWSGIVTRDVIEPLAQAIKRHFGENKLFSTLFDSYIRTSPFPRRDGAIANRHCRLDEIDPFLDGNDPFIWIIAASVQWSIFLDPFVCLTQRGV